MHDLALALELADAADALTLPAFDRGKTATEKADGTPVTEADREVERVLRERLTTSRAAAPPPAAAPSPPPGAVAANPAQHAKVLAALSAAPRATPTR